MRSEDLGIFTGRPRYGQPLHVGRPNIGSRERFFERLNDILDRKWLTNNGPYVVEFEGQVAEYLGCKHCIAVCNGTVALEIAIKAMGLTGEVIVPSFTFIATAHALKWHDVTPVFCDIESDSSNIDPRCVEKLVSPKTTGIIGVHVWGRPCKIEMLADIARKHQIRLLFDAAHAFGSSYKGRMIGNFGDAEVFSFHATKVINTFEGGAIVTNNDELADRVRRIRNFGFAGYDQVAGLGTNGKMSEVSAAMGVTGLESLDEVIQTNYRYYKRYQHGLQNISGLRVLSYDETERSSYHYVTIVVDEREAGLSRDELHEVLHADNILARRYFYPGCHQVEPYRSYHDQVAGMLPETEDRVKRVLLLPTGPDIGQDDIDQICLIIRTALENGGGIRKILTAKMTSRLA